MFIFFRLNQLLLSTPSLSLDPPKTTTLRFQPTPTPTLQLRSARHLRVEVGELDPEVVCGLRGEQDFEEE